MLLSSILQYSYSNLAIAAEVESGIINTQNQNLKAFAIYREIENVPQNSYYKDDDPVSISLLKDLKSKISNKLPMKNRELFKVSFKLKWLSCVIYIIAVLNFYRSIG